MKQEFDALLTDTKSKMGTLPPMPLAVLQSLMESGRDAVNSAQSGQSGSMVTVTAKVPGKIATQLQQLSESAPGMGFPSGFSSPPPMGQSPAIGINPTVAPPGFPSGFTPPQAGAAPPGANLPTIPRVPNAGSPPGFPGGPPQSPSSKP